MGHYVETMFSVKGQVPWHGLGTVLEEEALDSKRAIQEAGLDWKVGLYPIYSKAGDKEVSVPDKRAVIRETDKTCLGVVGSRYTPFQNEDAFEFIDGLLLSQGAHYETAGSLMGGRKVWLLAQLPGTIEPVKGDKQVPFVLLANTHDGTGAIIVTLTSVRVVCWNTLSLALGGRDRSSSFYIRHTKSSKLKIEEARTVLGLIPKYYKEIEQFQRVLSQKEFGRDQMKGMTEEIFKVDKEKEISTRTRRNMTELVYLYEHGKGNDRPGVRGTALAALNAATEYDTYYSPRKGKTDRIKQERRFNDLWFNSGQTMQSEVSRRLVKLVA